MLENRRKHIVICGYYVKKNLGDDLMSVELPRVLSCGGQHEVRLFSDDSGHGVLNGEADASYLQADVIVIGGGGVVTPNLWALWGHRLQSLVACGKKVAFVNVNVTTSIFCADQAPFIADLKRLNAKWWVRDLSSVSILAAFGIESTYVPDISMRDGVVETVPSGAGGELNVAGGCHAEALQVDGGKRQLAVFLNSYAFAEFFNRSSSVERSLRAYANLLGIAEYLDWMTSWGWQVTLWPAQTEGDVDDRTVSGCVHAMMRCKKDATWIIGTPSYEALTRTIAEADLNLSMRYHVTTIAAACGRPLVDITFHPKNRDFLAETGLTEISVPFDGLTQDRLILATQTAERIGSPEKLTQFRSDAQRLWAQFDQEWQTFLAADTKE